MPAMWADRRDDYGTRIRAGKAQALLNYPNNPNVMRSELYGSGLYAAESCLLAFPWIISVTTNVPKFGNHEGPLEVQLAVTRDLENFERPFRTPILSPAKQPNGIVGPLAPQPTRSITKTKCGCIIPVEITLTVHQDGMGSKTKMVPSTSLALAW